MKSFKVNKIEISHSSNMHLSNVLDGKRMNVLKKYDPSLSKRITEKKERLFKPGFLNYACPNFFCSRMNKFAYIMIIAENILLKKMSYENIFRHLIQYERLKRILLSEEQSTLIDNLPKIKIEDLKDAAPLNKNELINSVNAINENSQDKINDKLMKIFE